MSKIFYISPQRCGTKSFGDFFKQNGYKVASWDVASTNKWVMKCLEGQYNNIINSEDFINHQVFEDGPWFIVDLVKFIYHEIPDSKFVYFNRPSKDWFKSMVTHSGGRTIGNTLNHCLIYNRLEDYYYCKDNLDCLPGDKLFLFDNAEHYIKQYNQHKLYVRAFFENKPKNRFFSTDLYNINKFKLLNDAFDLKLNNVNEQHSHITQITPSECLRKYFNRK